MKVFEKLVCDPVALSILTRLADSGHSAYFVGGCVRDSLLGREPKDWDIATDARPEEIEELFEHTVPVGKSFGVMLVVIEGAHFEVATFRGEGAYSDGRRPDRVHFTTAEEDVRRRDLTINSLLYDPLEEEILDFTGGFEDIRDGVIRTVGAPSDRFLEDHLRMLRAVRFAAWTGFRITDEILAAIRELGGLTVTVSRERIGQELTRMFSEGYARRSLDLLEESGLLLHVLPEVSRMRGVPQPERFHPEGCVWSHTAKMLGLLDEVIDRSCGFEPSGESAQPGGVVQADGPGHVLLFPERTDREILCWASLLHDVGKPETISYSDRIRFNGHTGRSEELAETILTRLCRPGKIVRSVCELVGGHMRFCHIAEMREAKRRRLLQNPLFLLHLELHRLDCLGSHGKLGAYDFGIAGWIEEQSRPPEKKPLLNGNQLMDMGYSPGPGMGKILKSLLDAQLEGEVSSVDEATEWVRSNFSPDSGDDVHLPDS